MLHPLLAAVTAAVSSSFVSPPQRVPASPGRRRRPGGFAVRCASNGGGVTAGADTKSKLKVGSPIVIVEAPVMLKTAASVPSLRHNDGQVKAGDVGRIMARKPKDVWVVRLAVGSYLLDGKFFSPLDSDDGDDGETQAQVQYLDVLQIFLCIAAAGRYIDLQQKSWNAAKFRRICRILRTFQKYVSEKNCSRSFIAQANSLFS